MSIKTRHTKFASFYMVSFHWPSAKQFSWMKFLLLHLRRTENSTFAREDGQISFAGYPSFLMYMYNIIWIIPFLRYEKSSCNAPCGTMDPFTKLISELGSTYSGPNNVRLKPFSATIFKFFIWIIATITKICTKNYFKSNHLKFLSWFSQTFTRSNFSLRLLKFTKFLLFSRTVKFWLEA